MMDPSTTVITFTRCCCLKLADKALSTCLKTLKTSKKHHSKHLAQICSLMFIEFRLKTFRVLGVARCVVFLLNAKWSSVRVDKGQPEHWLHSITCCTRPHQTTPNTISRTATPELEPTISVTYKLICNLIAMYLSYFLGCRLRYLQPIITFQDLCTKPPRDGSSLSGGLLQNSARATASSKTCIGK